jgi:teichuronic acid biosynthesis glycosyltransferase TuaG
MIFVSIVIPYYKKKKYFKKTITSILNQSFKNFEIIIVFDEGRNENLGFIKQILKKDKRIKLIVNTKNLGAGVSRNIGIQQSKGKFIAFIDADDIWHKDKLKKQLKYMQSIKSVASHTSYQIINENGKVLSERTAKKLNYKNLLNSCDIGLSTVIIKKNLFKKNTLFPNLKTKEDYVLWLNLSKKGIIFEAVKKNLAKWRSSKLSLSSSTIQKFKDAYLVYSRYEKLGVLISLYRVLILSVSYIKKSRIFKRI